MRRFVALLAAVATLATLASVVTAANPGVRTTGDERVVLNAMVQATLRFTPGMIKVDSDEEVTWTHDDATTAPHTVTIVADPPGASLEEIFACAECGAALAAHGALGPVVDVGEPGLDQPGDSLLFFEDQSVTAAVTAPSGTTLQYVCAIHPWMQGTIEVR